MLRRSILFTFVLLSLILGSTSAFANGSVSGWCEIGNRTVTIGGVVSVTKVMQSFPACTVTVYVTGTVTKATIYSNNDSSPTPLANPFTATSLGHWQWYASGGHYDVVLSGGGLPAPFTISDVIPTSTTMALGTANQVIVTYATTNGTVTISTPQDIATTSTPTFGSLTINGVAAGPLLAGSLTVLNNFQDSGHAGYFRIREAPVSEGAYFESGTIGQQGDYVEIGSSDENPPSLTNLHIRLKLESHTKGSVGIGGDMLSGNFATGLTGSYMTLDKAPSGLMAGGNLELGAPIDGASANLARVEIGGNNSGIFYTDLSSKPYGLGFRFEPAVYNNTSSSGTVSTVYPAHSIGIPTLTATNSVTYTTAATWYIDGPPVASTRVGITHPYTLYIASGVTYMSAIDTLTNRLEQINGSTVGTWSASGLTVTSLSFGGNLLWGADNTYTSGLINNRALGTYTTSIHSGASALTFATSSGDVTALTIDAGQLATFSKTLTMGGGIAIGNNNSATNQFAGLGWNSSAGGVHNTGYGNNVFAAVLTGNYNTMGGNSAGSSLTSGSGNTAWGEFALGTAATSSLNTAMGINSLAVTTNSGNVGIGAWSGRYAVAANEFYLNDMDQGSNALEKTNSLLYGTFNGTPSSQTLKANAAVTVTYGLTLTAIHSNSGTRYLCVDTAGVVSASASACSGS